MFARIGVMRAPNREHVREFNTREGHALGKAEAGARSMMLAALAF
jgi:hypothetical protein